MKTAVLAFVFAAAALFSGEAEARPPIIVELFTAQGCASCAPANALIDDLAEQPDVIALTYSVDYWDYLGWEDTFARPEFAERQKAYVRRFALREPYTPQVVVNGRFQASGARSGAVEKLVSSAWRGGGWNPPDMLFMANGRIAVGSGPAPRGGGEVWLIRYDPREQTVEIKRGENRGASVQQRNVVRQIVRLGAWRGRPAVYRPPAAVADGLETIVLVQASRDGRVLGVLKQTPAPSAQADES
ncbi:MAG: DUF1223 domain-containing protein [Caulobacteraceae bacterium]